jgi:anti-sigma B factor antagonist
MNLTTDRRQDVSIVRVREGRLMYPLLSEFSDAVTGLIGGGQRKVVLDLSAVTYVDSATIGCLMDLYRQAAAAGGTLKLAGVQKRVETMLTMTGAQNFLEIHPDEAARPRELRSVTMRTIKTTTGAELALDGDLLAVMETLYREVTARRELERSFEDMIREINHLIDQMDEGERRAYLLESLFLNTVRYENDKLDAYMSKISDRAAGHR